MSRAFWCVSCLLHDGHVIVSYGAGDSKPMLWVQRWSEFVTHFLEDPETMARVRALRQLS